LAADRVAVSTAPRSTKNNPSGSKNASECTDAEYLDFYRSLYPLEPDPIFWIHLNVDYPFHLQGILYFPKITRRFDWSHNTIKLFCNRVFVSDNCHN
jgi:molecular chaperone HtpG